METKKKELAKEYLELKEKVEKLQNRISMIRNILSQTIAESGIFEAEGRMFILETRESVDYDIGKIRGIIGPDKYLLVVKTMIDKKKLGGLIKGGFITKEQIEPAKIITRSSTALVVK